MILFWQILTRLLLIAYFYYFKTFYVKISNVIVALLQYILSKEKSSIKIFKILQLVNFDKI